MKQWLTLACISIYENPPAINEVAETMGSSHQNVKQILMKLERMGLICIVSDEKDKRKLRIHLTKQSAALDEKYREASQHFIDQLFKGIESKTLQTTIKVLAQMEANLIEMRRSEIE